jgi:hypothetical protein
MLSEEGCWINAFKRIPVSIPRLACGSIILALMRSMRGSRVLDFQLLICPCFVDAEVVFGDMMKAEGPTV